MEGGECRSLRTIGELSFFHPLSKYLELETFQSELKEYVVTRFGPR
jgi:hypothetical protein